MISSSPPLLRLRILKQKARLKPAEGEEHEEPNAWSNRDLIPLPPSRRTWCWFEIFGYWTISSLNVTNWQTPNTYLTYGLSVGQSMMVIVLGRFLIFFFATLIAWCGLRWHIGFTVQNRYTWGLRGSYIPLLQRILLNFIWCAIQCWNGGRLTAVCITAIWPSFATLPNTLPSSMPTTTAQFIGFIVFWTLSLPFLLIRPEKFRLPFILTSAYCGLAMLSMMIWALSAAGGVGPLWTTGQAIPASSPWNSSWLITKGINTLIGGIAAGITNGSDFSRYVRSPTHYVSGTLVSAWLVGTLVSLIGLVVTAAAQKLYGAVYWNPPDLLLRMMDDGNGSRGSRAAVFFLAAGFALAGMFENICGNSVAGGIDLAGLLPRYVDIRRGAVVTFVAVWVVQPWQLINRAATFVEVMNSFAVFLAPLMGVMVCDFFLLRGMRIRLSGLYVRGGEGGYWFWRGLNWRVVPAWLAGWAPTVGGLVVTVQGKDGEANRVLLELYYMAFLIGFFISGTVFFVLNKLFPYTDYGGYDDVDVYGTFTAEEAQKLGIAPAPIAATVEVLDGIEGSEKAESAEMGEKGVTTAAVMKQADVLA